jgi:PAS domain S-box-containing protein
MADERERSGRHVPWLAGGGELGELMRAKDWSATPLGPPDLWPQSLRSAVSILLPSRAQICLFWGPDLAALYNDAYRPALGIKHPWALGRPAREMWSELWDDVLRPLLEGVLRTGEALWASNYPFALERHGFPEETYFDISYDPVRDESGGVGGIFCIVSETTGRVLGERRLALLRDLGRATSEARSVDEVFRNSAAVLDSNAFDVPFAVLLDATGKPIAGCRTTQMYGWPIDQAHTGEVVLRGTDLEPFGPLSGGPWREPAHTALVLPVAAPGQPRSGVLVAGISPRLQLDDAYRDFLRLIASSIGAGVAAARALEEQRAQARALAELDRAKTAFFSNVSHEFRTPLTLMIGPIEEELRTNPAAAPRLEVAHRSSLRLLKLVNTLLDFSRIEAGRIAASYEPVELAGFTAELASMFRSAVEKAGLRLIIECEPLPEPVYVDRDMWEKIVLNLLSNAFKFTFAGEIAVSLGWRGDRVELAIRDTGVGIPEAELPKMFERFYRVKHVRSRTHEGTGIGLALVRELARLHGGDVAVESREGAGSTFRVSIRTGSGHLAPDRIQAPRDAASTALGATVFVEEARRWLPEADDAAVAEIAPGASLGPGSPEPDRHPPAHVLLVDDNADMREYVRSLLARDYIVTTAVDGQEALDRLRREPVDLLITDVMMPRLDGMELIAAIRVDERLNRLPVIVLTARAGEEARMQGLAAGADAYLVKPFSARELLATVSSQLQLARVRLEHEHAALQLMDEALVAQQAARFRAEQFETLLNQAPLGVFLVDADFRLAQANPVALPAFGELPGGVIGRDFAEIMRRLWSPAYAEEVIDIFRRTLETGEPYMTPERGEYRVDRGTTEYYEWRVDRIALPDGRYGLVCYFREISAHVRARGALEEADRRKDEFLALLAHELRNPLAPLRNGIEILRRAPGEDESRRKVVDVMSRQVSQLVRLTDDLLNVSRISRGLVVLRREAVDLETIVASAIETSQPALDRAGVRLDVELPETAVRLSADGPRLVQVIGNLLNNAAKFTPAGGRVTVAAAVEDDTLVLRVRDTGIGMDPARLADVFEMFIQIDTSLERTRSGLGLGLTIVKRLVEQHGGSVEARSAGIGQGAEFIIRLPLRGAPPEVPARPAASAAAVDAPRALRVLIVEDNHDSATMLATLLTMAGHAVHTAHDGQHGVDAVDLFRPDVVLLDIGLPVLNGYDAAQRIRACERGRDVRLVALTGWGQEADRQRSASSGFDAHLVKPVDPSMLMRTIADLMDKPSNGVVSS